MPAPLTVYDGFVTLQRGMNGGVLSTQIHEQQYAKGINVTCRNGAIATRPPFMEIELDMDSTSIETGHFQGMAYYEHRDTAYVIFGFNGSVYSYEPITGLLSDLTATAGRFNQYVDRLHFVQVEEYFIVQDGVNLALIVEGTIGRKAVPGDDEVPTGTVMAYCHGRLFVKTDNRIFLAGDINLPNDPTAVLKFIETEYLSNGGAFFIPADKGNIVSMTWMQAYEDATGEGDLMVLCERGIASYHVSAPRMNWVDMPLMKLQPSGKGCASEFATIKLNEDILFMGWEGLQDFALISAESSRSNRLTNLDREVKPFIDLETQWLLPYTSAAAFDGRVLYTAIGELATSIDEDGDGINDHRFKGLIALDFETMDGISTMGETLRPSFDGIWTGANPIGIISGLFDRQEKCFVFGKDDDGINHFYELKKQQGLDNGDTAIECRLYTRSMPFVDHNGDFPKPVPYREKKLIDGSLWVTSFSNDITFTLHTIPDFSVHPHEIGHTHINANMVQTVPPFEGGNNQARAKSEFSAFEHNDCELVSGRIITTGFEFQFLLTWTGVATISKLMLTADSGRGVNKPECGTVTKILTGTPPDDFGYDMESA